MPKLINRPQTNLGEQTTNKKTLQFSNPAIEKYLPTFGNLRHKSIPFKVPLKSHLKGLTLRMSKATKLEPVVIMRANSKDPLVVLSVDHFFDLIK